MYTESKYKINNLFFFSSKEDHLLYGGCKHVYNIEQKLVLLYLKYIRTCVCCVVSVLFVHYIISFFFTFYSISTCTKTLLFGVVYIIVYITNKKKTIKIEERLQQFS